MDLKELEVTKNTENRHPWEIARLFVIQSKIKQIFNKKDEKVILDIGCGDTWLIERLSKKFPNFKFIAVDTAFNDEMLDMLNNQLRTKNISVFKSLDAALKDYSEPIDLILLLDVIEHIKDDIEFLKSLNCFININKQTTFLITAPSYQSLVTNHDLFLNHYRRYSNKTLCLNIESSGLKVIDKGYFFFILLIFRSLLKIKEKILTPNQVYNGVGGWKKTPFDNLIVIILKIDFIFGDFFRNKKIIPLPGLSNYVLCKQK